MFFAVLVVDLAHDHVAIGDGQRAATPISSGAGIGASRFGTDAIARAIEPADGAAARCDRVNSHHRRTQANAGDFGDKCALVFARPMRNVGRRPAHVETDDAIEPGESRHFDCADDAAGGP